MLKSLPKISPVKKEKMMGPRAETIQAILNYSKSVETKTINKQKVMIHLN